MFDEFLFSMNLITFTKDTREKQYVTPTFRVITFLFETSFLISNTERIDDDGQEHGWD